MGTQTTVLLVPGYKRTPRDCRALTELLVRRGHRVVGVEINWSSDKTIDDWTKQLAEVCQYYDPARTRFVGFSQGAVISLIVAASVQPRELWLMSLSARFGQDFTTPTPSWTRDFTRKQLTAFKRLDFYTLATSIVSETKLFVGEAESEEYPALWHRVSEAHRLIDDAELLIAKGAGHQLDHPGYLAAIKRAM